MVLAGVARLARSVLWKTPRTVSMNPCAQARSFHGAAVIVLSASAHPATRQSPGIVQARVLVLALAHSGVRFHRQRVIVPLPVQNARQARLQAVFQKIPVLTLAGFGAVLGAVTLRARFAIQTSRGTVKAKTIVLEWVQNGAKQMTSHFIVPTVARRATKRSFIIAPRRKNATGQAASGAASTVPLNARRVLVILLGRARRKAIVSLSTRLGVVIQWMAGALTHAVFAVKKTCPSAGLRQNALLLVASGVRVLTAPKIIVHKAVPSAMKRTNQSASILLTVHSLAAIGAALIVLRLSAQSAQKSPHGTAVRLVPASRQKAFGALTQARLMVIAPKRNAQSAQKKLRGIAATK